MNKHTPGEWWAGSDEDAHMVYADDNSAVADCGRDDGDAEQEAANAQLIAAAPELLAACEFVARQCCACPGTPGKAYPAIDHYPDCVIPVVNAAIAKAKGKE